MNIRQRGINALKSDHHSYGVMVVAVEDKLPVDVHPSGRMPPVLLNVPRCAVPKLPNAALAPVLLVLALVAGVPGGRFAELP